MEFRYALSSEVYKLPIEETVRRAARAGYDGIEIAPFTVADSVDEVPPPRREEIARIARGEGIEIVGLHWLLVSPKGLHLTTPDGGVRRRTVAYLEKLVRFAADLGAKVLVFGSPKQRSIAEGDDRIEATCRAVDALRAVAEACAERGVLFLLEPLAPAETNFVNTVEEALEIIRLVGHPSLGYHLDVKAMASMPGGIIGTIREYGGGAGHFHANEPGGLAPGMGSVDFRPILDALAESGYRGWISVEPFSYEPDPDVVARTALATLRAAAGWRGARAAEGGSST